MATIVDLKIKLDLLRIELGKEMFDGASTSRITQLKDNIKAAEQLMIMCETIPEQRS